MIHLIISATSIPSGCWWQNWSPLRCTFAYTHPIEVIPGNIHQPLGVKTKLGWILAGEYEISLNPESTYNNHSTTTKPLFYHVSRQQTEELLLSELVEQFWKNESEGSQENSCVLSDEDNDASKIFWKTLRDLNWFSLENALHFGEQLLLCS